MNFIKLYIGDYLRDTGTLTVAEHGAYMLMLMHHYATERPLPTGRELHRLLRAETKADREAIDGVVRRFWTETAGGLVNNRAGKEMERAEHQREVNRTVGKLGGRPKRTETESVSESEPNENRTGTLTRHQTPDTVEPNGSTTPPDPPKGARPTRKPPDAFALSAELSAWAAEHAPSVDAEAETAKFRDHTFASSRSDWVATWRNWMRRAQERAAERGKRAQAQPVGETLQQRAARERVAAMTGGLVSAKPPKQQEVIDGLIVPIRALG